MHETLADPEIQNGRDKYSVWNNSTVEVNGANDSDLDSWRKMLVKTKFILYLKLEHIDSSELCWEFMWAYVLVVCVCVCVCVFMHVCVCMEVMEGDAFYLDITRSRQTWMDDNNWWIWRIYCDGEWNTLSAQE
jgi:hypothetical protein